MIYDLIPFVIGFGLFALLRQFLYPRLHRVGKAVYNIALILMGIVSAVDLLRSQNVSLFYHCLAWFVLIMTPVSIAFSWHEFTEGDDT